MRRNGHQWIATERNRSRCARCDAQRNILDDGEVQFFTAAGARRSESPLCVPKSGDRASRCAEVRA